MNKYNKKIVEGKDKVMKIVTQFNETIDFCYDGMISVCATAPFNECETGQIIYTRQKQAPILIGEYSMQNCDKVARDLSAAIDKGDVSFVMPADYREGGFGQLVKDIRTAKTKVITQNGKDIIDLEDEELFMLHEVDVIAQVVTNDVDNMPIDTPIARLITAVQGTLDSPSTWVPIPLGKYESDRARVVAEELCLAIDNGVETFMMPDA